MSTTEESVAALEDFKVPAKLKIAALWTAAMFCYIYGDIFVLQEPGHLEKLIAGTVWNGGPLTQGLLLTFAVSMAIPSVMVFLSLVLNPSISRWANIILGFLCTLGPLLTIWGAWHFYVLLSVIEMLLTSLIVWYAWRWPRQRSQ